MIKLIDPIEPVELDPCPHCIGAAGVYVNLYYGPGGYPYLIEGWVECAACGARSTKMSFDSIPTADTEMVLSNMHNDLRKTLAKRWNSRSLYTNKDKRGVIRNEIL